MSDALANLLPRLEGVRESNGGQYTARCPAHEDRSPSLSVTEGRNGQVLVYCFAGCTVDEICGAVGLEVTDLFPDGGRNRARDPRNGPVVNWRKALREMLTETSVLELYVAKLRRGELVTDVDEQRVEAALERLRILRGAVSGC